MTATRTTRLSYRTSDALIVLTCILAHALYLLLAYLRDGNFGFPLDDAWIYQTYARNLAHTGQWAFVAGQPSTGSTSILWTLLVAPTHLINLDPRLWTHLLGLLMLIAAALGAARLFEDDPPITSLIVGLAVAMEWHLVWAAASGMETMLFAALLIWFWVWLRRRDPALVGHRFGDGLAVGMWGGMLMLARPEGVLPFALAGLYGLLAPAQDSGIVRRLGWGLGAGGAFALFIIPFFALNVIATGQVWPNTFYAKQTEYSGLWQIAYPLRLMQQIAVVFIGTQLLLLPGIIYELYRDLRNRTDWVSILPVGWVLAHLALYAARLPVTYQHGRYAIPVISILMIYGIRGMLRLARPRHRQLAVRLASLTWLISVAVLHPLVLAILGAPAYANDVAFIEDEMVSAARWIRENTDSDTVIAAHDIGAIGYFAPRPLIDLAGLISPDVIPFMNEPSELANYILTSEATYLIAFPGWPDYPIMLANPQFCPVWSAASESGYIQRDQQAGSMTIYRINPDGDCPTE